MRTPGSQTFRRGKRLAGAFIVALGGLVLLDQVAVQLSPEGRAPEDRIYPTDGSRPPPSAPGRVVEA
jgi:hypothetical protein